MADNFLTPEFRAAFISVFRASKAKDAKPEDKPKFSIRACFPPDADLSKLKAEAQKAAEEKWGVGKIPKTIRSPFRRNDELGNPVVGLDDDWIIVTFSANEDRRPGIVDAGRQDIIDENDVYSGAWYRVQCDAYGYDNKGNRGVAFGLKNVQKLREDDPLGGGGRVPASKAFEEPGEGGAKTAKSMFD